MKADKIEDIYAVSPLQGGILFETLYASEAGVYLDRNIYTLRGEVDPNTFAHAWGYLIQRHAVLRTSFHWEGVPEPLQVVHKAADLPLEWLDWREMAEDEQRKAFEAFLKED